MKIKKIKINNYGNLENKEINLENNINIIYGKNESGKSTLLNYIKNIFYGISKNKNGKEISDYEKYKPWGKDDFSGKLKYELDNGEEFEIFRDFNKKNPKIFNKDLEEVSKDFNIVKKDGVQFFYDQTNVDETMFTSTVLSMQNEVKLGKEAQSILVQKLANLAGTGDDNVSFKKVMDKLNKMQVEDVGSDRTQGRPINIVKNRMKEIELVLKELHIYQKDKSDIEDKKISYDEKIKKLEDELNLLKEINIILLNKQKAEEKINIKNNYKNEKNNKINELNYEKNNLINKNKINEKIEGNNSKKNNNKNEINIKNNNAKNKNNFNKKINIKKYILILFFILIINLIIYFLNKYFIKNNLLNIFNYFLIPIYLILIFILEKNKIKKINKENKIEKEKINNEINLLNKQIELLIEEKNKIENEINQEENNLDNEIEIELGKIKEKYSTKFDVNSYLDKIGNNNITNLIYNVQEELNNNKLELQKIKIEEENILNKLDDMVNLKEEYDNLKERFDELEEENASINLTKDILTKAYINMRNNVTPKFTENLSKNISAISNNKYTKVGINDEKGLIVENEFGEYIPAERLSIGTIDQLYLSLRLSMIDDLSKEKMPIILDEAFAYYDDLRLENILKFLSTQLEEHQLIIFTCTKREEKILNNLSIPYNLVEL